jgi:hypothetical protein
MVLWAGRVAQAVEHLPSKHSKKNKNKYGVSSTELCNNTLKQLQNVVYLIW